MKLKVLSLVVLCIAPFQLMANCQEAFKAYQKSSFTSPIRNGILSSTHIVQGGASTSAGLSDGFTNTDTGLTTAGIANGTAFSYEGQYYIELIRSDLRHFRGRQVLLQILNQAEIGLGEELENLLVDVNDAREKEEEDPYDLAQLVEIISVSNQKNIFCPEFKEIFTLESFKHYLIQL